MVFAGRTLRIRRGEAVIAGARTDSFNISRTYVDITDKDDNGVRRFLPHAYGLSIDASVEGVLMNLELFNLARQYRVEATPFDGIIEPSELFEFDIDVAGQGTYSGLWALPGFDVSGADTDALTFSASLQSSGVISFVANEIVIA